MLLVCGRARAQTTAAATVPVAARELARGAVLADEDIAPPAGEALTAAARRALRGWVTRRRVSAGEPLRPPAVHPPAVIRAGEAVQLIWREGTLEIRLRGRAMNQASAGDRVAVRVDVGRRFEGTAIGEGLVQLHPLQRNP